MGLVDKSKELEKVPSSLSSDKQEDSIQEFILHTVCRRYPDGRIFHVKTWTTQKGVVKPKRKKVKKMEPITKKSEDDTQWM